jgi:hypothetical protein
VKYNLCAWKCYNNGVGWTPQCVDFLTAKEAALGPPEDPADYVVTPSQCDATCYTENLADLYQLDTFQVKYAQQTSPQCQDIWVMQQAIELKTIQAGPFPEQVPAALPAWLSEEVARQEANPVDPEEVLRALEACQVCNPDGITGSDVVVPGGGASSPASEPAGFPIPAPLPAPIPAPVPAPIPAPILAPVLAPALAPAPAPAPVPQVPGTPPPAPVVVPASAGFTPSFKGVCVVAVSSVATMLFV